MLTVEIKARILNYNDMITKIYRVMCRTYLMESIDKYYLANNGTLMLRRLDHGYASLISYKRSNEKDLQVCTSYGSLLCHKLTLLEDMLNLSNGLLSIIKKKRQIYFTEKAQINVDNVNELGHFVEIKVVDKDIETAKKIVNDLMQKLSITSDELITKSYLDLMLEKNMEIFEPETFDPSDLFRRSHPKTSNMFGASSKSEISETSEISEV